MGFLKTMCRAGDLTGDGTRSKDVLYFNSQVSATQQGTIIAALKTQGDTKLLSSGMKTSGQRWYREAGNVHEPAVKVSIANTPEDARFDKMHEDDENPGSYPLPKTLVERDGTKHKRARTPITCHRAPLRRLWSGSAVLLLWLSQM